LSYSPVPSSLVYVLILTYIVGEEPSGFVIFPNVNPTGVALKELMALVTTIRLELRAVLG
jgi:hypothetical protein